MDSLLARQLSSLGQDAHLRKKNLLNLVPCLTHQEIRDLALRLSEADLRTDIIGRLPVELRFNVAQHLEEIDIFALLNVSRHWRALWLQPDILKILSQWCPYLDHNLFAVRIVGQDSNPQETPAYELIRLRRRRCLGKFSSTTVVWHDFEANKDWLIKELHPAGLPQSVQKNLSGGGPPLEHHTWRESLYQSGRLAWVSDQLSLARGLINVEDLRAGTRNVYRNASTAEYGRDLSLLALGDKLVVAGTSRLMFVWHLESHSFSQVTLPQQPCCCVTRGEYVAFLRRDSLYFWKLGSEMMDVYLEPVLDWSQRISATYPIAARYTTLGVFFHPLEEGTLFISVSFAAVRCLSVHEFSAGQYVGSREVNLDDIREAFGFKIIDRFGSGASCRVVQPVNSLGDFLVAELEAFNAHIVTSSNADTSQSARVGASRRTVIEVRFNVYTGGFSLIKKSLPNAKGVSIQTQDLGAFPLLSWNNQMTLLLETGKVSRQLDPATPISMVVIPVCHTTSGRAEIPKIHSLHPSCSPYAHLDPACFVPRLITAEEHLAGRKLDLATSVAVITDERYPTYLMIPEPGTTIAEFAKSLYSTADFVIDLSADVLSLTGLGTRPEMPHRIFQDDEFIVMFHNNGYIAWDFRDGPSLPRAPHALKTWYLRSRSSV